jgi:3-phosphoshikimate 1-carboxyvinyltransferase
MNGDGDVAVAPAPRGLRGTLRVPGDKSIGHRALLLGALAEGRTRVAGLPGGADVRSTRACLRDLGVRIDEEGGETTIHGRGGAFEPPASTLDCGNSGTTMRLLAALLATQDFGAVLDGDASLRARPMRRIADPLCRMGAQIELRGGELAPMRVHGSSRLRGISYTLPVASAQLKSALLLAGLRAHGLTTLDGAVRSRDHTERMLPLFGARFAARNGSIGIEGPQRLRAPARPLRVPGDLSSAAYWIAAAAIIPESRLSIEDVGLNPSRLGFIEVLSRMGASIELRPRGLEGEPYGTLVAAWSPLRATSVGAGEVPSLIDELPLLAVVAAFAEGTTYVRGAHELRHKESDRIAAVVRNGRAMGMRIDEFADGFAVHGPASLRACEIDAMGDHRIAMAFSIAALANAEPTKILGAGSVAISYPEFFATLEGLRG